MNGQTLMKNVLLMCIGQHPSFTAAEKKHKKIVGHTDKVSCSSLGR